MPCQPEPREQDLRSPSRTQGEGEDGLLGPGTHLIRKIGLHLVVQLPAEGGEEERSVSGAAGEPVGQGWGADPRLTRSRRSSPRRSAARSRPPCWARRWRAPPRTPRAAGGSGC